MNITDLAQAVQSTAVYEDNAENFLRMLGVPEDAIVRMNPQQYRPIISMIYVGIGAANEAGEALGPLKKMLRGDHDVAAARKLFVKESTDVMWYSMEALRVAGDGAETELGRLLEKLAARQATNTIKGSGESVEDRIDRFILAFLHRLKLAGGYLHSAQVGVPGELLNALIESKYIHTTLSGVTLGLKGDAFEKSN